MGFVKYNHTIKYEMNIVGNEWPRPFIEFARWLRLMKSKSTLYLHQKWGLGYKLWQFAKLMVDSKTNVGLFLFTRVINTQIHVFNNEKRQIR